MGHGKNFNIVPMFVNLPLLNNGDNENPHEEHSKTDDQNPKHLKSNAAPLFDKKWNDAQAAQRRNNLTTLLPNNEPAPTGRTNQQGKFAELSTNPSSPLHSESGQHSSNTLQHSETVLPTMRSTVLSPQTNSSAQNNLPAQNQQSNNLLKQSWQDLVNNASQHQDFENFRHESPKFWDSVVKMSELRTVETYINGQVEPRVTSRYGELLQILNRQGGAAHLENFLNNLPSGEREVFLARYQINQTFGANELFAGRGIMPDVSGRFPLQVFLSENGKNLQVPVNTLIGLFGGDAVAIATGKTAALFEQNGFAASYQFLLNPKSAALLSLSLALYQNINALLSIDELTPEAFLQKAASEFVAPALTQNQARASSKNTFEKAETENVIISKRFSDETLVGGALINGALKTIEKYRQAKYTVASFPAGSDDSPYGFGFAAGATGAMMGATIGSVVPLAEKSVGEILGFASSVVVGLTDAGIRTLGANALVSLITSGVQSFLNASGIERKSLPEGAPDKFLGAANSFESDLQNSFFNHPILVSK